MYASFLATQPVYDFSGAEKMASACKKGSLSGEEYSGALLDFC
tara:strand:- start:61 stop:189 length:129 start_codon:yes stop_codon:yes gene_type:complete